MPAAVVIVGGCLWVAGLAVALAAFSYADWLAKAEGQAMSAILGGSGLQRTLAVGCALFNTGLAVAARAWWQSALWAGLALASAGLWFWAGMRKS